MSIEEMRAKAAKIRTDNLHWKRCQDGSFEMALDQSGYFKLLDEIKTLTAGKAQQES